MLINFANLGLELNEKKIVLQFTTLESHFNAMYVCKSHVHKQDVKHTNEKNEVFLKKTFLLKYIKNTCLLMSIEDNVNNENNKSLDCF